MCLVIKSVKADGSIVICGFHLSATKSTTGTLVKHLKSKHSEAYREYEPRGLAHKEARDRRSAGGCDLERADTLDELEGRTPRKHPRGTPNPEKLKYGVRDPQQLKFDMETTEFIVECGLPWSIVETKGFKKYISRRDPKCNFKKAATLSKAKFPLLYQQVEKAVFEKIKRGAEEGNAIAFTADGWSSRAQQKFIGVTAHYITKDWVMERFVVACSPETGRSTGANIAEHYCEIVAKLNLNDSVTITLTTDNAANMKLAARIAEKSAKCDLHLGCFDHTLQLVVNSVLNPKKQVVDGVPVPPTVVEAAISACKRLTKLSHFSDVIPAYLANVVDQLNAETSAHEDLLVTPQLSYVKFANWTSTRWNSMLFMFRSIIRMRPVLDHIKAQDADPLVTSSTPKGLLDAIPSQDQLDIIEGLMPILTHFEETTNFMSGEKYPTINWAVGRLFALEHACQREAQAAPTEEVHEACLALLEKLKERYPKFGSDNISFGQGCMLNPSLRGLVLNKVGTYQTTMDSILQEEDTNVLMASQARSPTTVKVVTDPLLLLMREMDPVDLAPPPGSQSHIAPAQPLRAELTAYLTSRDGMGEIEPHEQLDWWKAREVNYPLLCAIVRKLFAIQATSAPVERTFSAGGLVVQPKRTNLKGEHVHKLVFLHENLSRMDFGPFKYTDQSEAEEENLIEDY